MTYEIIMAGGLPMVLAFRHFSPPHLESYCIFRAKNLYQVLERLMKLMVMIMIFAFFHQSAFEEVCNLATYYYICTTFD